MADRDFRNLLTQGRRHVELALTFTAAAGVALWSQGDSAASATGSYANIVKTSTGVYTITTTNPYIASVGITGSRLMATPTGNALLTFGKPSQNATTGVWSITVNTWTNAAGTHSAADIVDGDLVTVRWTLRNSTVLP
jgi:hypothetical protein